MTNELQTRTDDSAQVVEFTPAVAILTGGKTKTESKVLMVQGGTAAAQLYLVSQKGKVGKAAQAGLSERGIVKMASEVRHGHYLSLAQALAVTLGRSIVLRKRHDLEGLSSVFEGMIADLKNGGYKDGKKTAALRAIEEASLLVTMINDCVARIIADEKKIETPEAPEAPAQA